MLAHLQQASTIGALLVATLWALACGWAGQAGWGAAGAAFIVGGYALVLALEFSILRLVHGSDPTPRASAAQLLRAWLGEVLAAPRVFCWRQPFRSLRWPDQLPVQARGHRGVLLIHGFVCNRGVWNRWLERLTAAGVPVVAANLEPVFGAIDNYVATIDDGMKRLEQATGMAPVVVAHSMGGLALRRWWVEQDDDSRVHHAITIATPHQGTWLARFALSCNARQMQLHSPWRSALAAREPAARARRFTCYYSHCDNIVFPPASATLTGADNRHLTGVAHVHMVDHPAPWAELQRLLAGDPPTRTLPP